MPEPLHHSGNASLNFKSQLSRTRGEEIVQSAFDELDQSIPTHMPILEAFLDMQGKRLPLERVTALLIQHQLGNHVPQARALLRLGLKPENLIWLDVPYTSNATVRTALEDLGIPRRNLRVHDYEVLQPYAPYQLRRTQTIYRELLTDPPEHLLVLDDGAYFLEAMCTMKSRLRRVSVVEQTTRGLIKIEESALLQCCARTLPIVNVARSRPKMTLEPPFIGRAICGALVRRVKSFPQCLSGPALVLGFGAIGSRVAESLAGCMNGKRELVYVFDTDPVRRGQARANGYSIWDRNDFDTRFRLVIGCSGRASFTVGDMIYLENDAVLASASSGSVELSRQEFIDLADSSDLDDVMVCGGTGRFFKRELFRRVEAGLLQMA
jgi:hypothetical protein